MGFSQGAITSNKNNRNLQRKQRSFGLKNDLLGKGLHGKKLPINEIKMRKLSRQSLLVEVVFYTIILGIALVSVYYLLT